MHLDSISVFESVVPRVPSRRKRKHRLADYQPVPKGDECLTLLRAQELFHGKPWKPEEEEHCQKCAGAGTSSPMTSGIVSRRASCWKYRPAAI